MRTAGAVTYGASPRVRGRPRGRIIGAYLHRSIPARAGATRLTDDQDRAHAEHPRACGGDSARAPEPRDIAFAGASPRVRGRHGAGRRASGEARSIPARAGATWSAMRRSSPASEHPRACGGDHWAIVRGFARPGASPRVRGRRRPRRCRSCSARSIPARAGATGPRRRRRRAPTGASPRVRGRLDPQRLRPAAGRSIPARAGATLLAVVASGGVSEHPRACGGDRGHGRPEGDHRGASPRVRGDGTGQVMVSRSCGASPRVRGRLAGPQPQVVPDRSIPARAGATPTATTDATATAEHPRACGGDTDCAEWPSPSSGASPRVRGRPSARRDDRAVNRSIPARAGATPARRRRDRRCPEHPRACGGDARSGRAGPR